MTHYETLGIGRDATDQQIKAAYRRAAWRHHPDREGAFLGQILLPSTGQTVLEAVQHAQMLPALEGPKA